MGMFDSVHTECPHCFAQVELQSKAGDCMLNEYQDEEVPIAIASDLALNYREYNTKCSCCEQSFRVHTDAPKTAKVYLLKDTEAECTICFRVDNKETIVFEYNDDKLCAHCWAICMEIEER